MKILNGERKRTEPTICTYIVYLGVILSILLIKTFSLTFNEHISQQLFVKISQFFINFRTLRQLFRKHVFYNGTQVSEARIIMKRNRLRK